MIFTSNPTPKAPDFSDLTDAALVKRLQYNQNQIRLAVRDNRQNAIRDLTPDQDAVVAEIARRSIEALAKAKGGA